MRRPDPIRVLLVVRAAFRRHPGCCPDPIEVGEPMARLATHTYVHLRCTPHEVDR